MTKAINWSEISVLIIEDSDYNRQLTRRMLQLIGVTNIHEAANGLEAFHFLWVESVDIIICDFAMDTMNGMEFVLRLRSGKFPEEIAATNAIQRDMPVVMLTAYAEKKFVEQAVKVGANGFLAKPVSINALKSAIEKAINSVKPKPTEQAVSQFRR